MKKLLALVLALVMVMGLATVGTSAAKYSDDADINYDEAVAVMSSIGVLEGADGKFRPAAELKRSEAAKIVAYLYYNNRTAAGLIGAGKFSDVPTNHWAAGYVDNLASSGIIAGRGNGTFDPDGELKAIDFAKMLLVCIGFNAKIEGLVGADYAINTSKLAAQAGLFKGMPDLKANDVLTREQAAQMAFNTVKAATVEYANKGGEISLNGATVSLGASNFNYVTTTIAKDATNISRRTLTNSGSANDKSGYTIEFGERQYPDLKCNPTVDDFGRPVNEWFNGKETIGMYTDEENKLGEFTTAVTGADMFNLLGEAKIKNTADKDFHYYVNGKEIKYVDPTTLNDNAKFAAGWYQVGAMARSNMIRGNKVPYNYTGNGVLTEAFERDDEIIVTSVITYLVKANGDFNKSTNKLAVKDQSWNGGVAPLFTAQGDLNYISAEKLPEISKYKDGDLFLARAAYTKDNKWEWVEVYDAKSDADVTINRYSVGKEETATNWANYVANRKTALFYNGWEVTGGKQTAFSKAVRLSEDMQDYNNKALDPKYTLYYDLYDYVIYPKPASTPDRYVFIAGLNQSNNNLGVTTADAFAIFADGTSGTIKVNVTKSQENIDKYQRIYKFGAPATADNNRDFSWPRTTKADNGANTIYPSTTPYFEAFGDNDYAYNRWFTYDVSGEGASAVYTLSPAANSIMVAADTTVAQTAKLYTLKDGKYQISTKAPRLVGTYYTDQKDVSGSPGNPSHVSAYGNEKSTYITVRSGKVSQTTRNVNTDIGGYFRGIAEVTGIYTGLQSVDILTMPRMGSETDESDLKKVNMFNESIWAVYDKDGYVVSAVIMGKDGGNGGNYAFGIEGAKYEEKGSDGKYYWEFQAIMNGELKTLKVKTDYKDVIAKIKNNIGFGGTNKNSMFNLSLDKDGYVTGVEIMDWNALQTDTTIYGNQKLANTNAANYAKAYDREAVYNAYFNALDTHYYKAQTMYNKFDVTGGNYAGDIGLTVASGAPIFVVQQKLILSTYQTVTDVQVFSDWNSALGSIADNATGEPTPSETFKAYKGYTAAVLNSNGTAKWAVIKSENKALTYNNTNNATPTTGATKSISLGAYGTPAGQFTVAVTGYSGVTVPVVVTWYDSTNVKTVQIPWSFTPDSNNATFTIGKAGADLVIAAMANDDTITVKIDGTTLTTLTRKAQ